MDGSKFDDLVRSLLGGGSRRRLLRSLGALPVVGGLAAVVSDAEAKNKNKGKDKDNNGGNGGNNNDNDVDGVDAEGKNAGKRRKQKRCQEKKSKACETQCGTVTVKCKKPNGHKAKKHRVNCGPCVCEPACTGGQCCSGTTCVTNCPAGQVCSNGTCAEACVCGTGCPFTSLQDAVDAVDPGTTINVCAGTYNVTQTITIDKDVTIVGAGAANTTFDGGDAVRVFLSTPGTDVDIRDLTVTRGGDATTTGNGIFNQGEMSLENVNVTDSSSAQGGGIVNNGAMAITGGTISGNTATQIGGGILNGTATAQLVLSNVTIFGNTTTDAASDGAGIYNVSGGGVIIFSSAFTENTAARDGGGIYNNGGIVDVSNSTFTDNTATSNSGAGLYNAGGNMVLDNTDITGGEAGDAGGGIYNRSGGTLTLNAGTTISANFATNNGGGVFNTGAGTTVVCSGGSTITSNTEGNPAVTSNCEDAGGGTGCATCPA